MSVYLRRNVRASAEVLQAGRWFRRKVRCGQGDTGECQNGTSSMGECQNGTCTCQNGTSGVIQSNTLEFPEVGHAKMAHTVKLPDATVSSDWPFPGNEKRWEWRMRKHYGAVVWGHVAKRCVELWLAGVGISEIAKTVREKRKPVSVGTVRRILWRKCERYRIEREGFWKRPKAAMAIRVLELCRAGLSERQIQWRLGLTPKEIDFIIAKSGTTDAHVRMQRRLKRRLYQRRYRARVRGDEVPGLIDGCLG